MLCTFRVFAKYYKVILLSTFIFGLISFLLSYNEKTYELTTIIENGVIYENGGYRDIEPEALFTSRTKTKYGGNGLKSVAAVDGLFVIKTASKSQQEAEALMDTIVNDVMGQHSRIFQMYLDDKENQVKYYKTYLERMDRQIDEANTVINSDKNNIGLVALMQLEKNRLLNNKMSLEREFEKYIKSSTEPRIKATKIINKQLRVADVLYKMTFLGIVSGFLLGLVYVIVLRHKEILQALNKQE